MTVTNALPLSCQNTWFTAANIASTAATVVVKPAGTTVTKNQFRHHCLKALQNANRLRRARWRLILIQSKLRVYDNGIVDGDIVPQFIMAM